MKILTVIGARPQFVKAAPLAKAASDAGIEEVILHTGQHYDYNMSEVFFDELSIPKPKYNLEISGGGHGAMTGKMLEGIEQILLSERPDFLLVYGDTNSTLAGALAAAKLHIPVAHVEAGLRSWNRKMPEEINRVLTDHVSNILFCSSSVSRDNLKREGIGEQVHIVGDIMADANRLAKEVTAKEPLKYLDCLPTGIDLETGYSLLTIHRAESTDNSDLLSGLVEQINKCDSMPIVFPVHPRTKTKLMEYGMTLADHVFQIDPVGYLEMTALLMNCSRVATDSGGLQKEAYWMNKPCVTLRAETEWLETVNEQCNVLWSPSIDLESHWAQLDLSQKQEATYGDSFSAAKIIDLLAQYDALKL